MALGVIQLEVQRRKKVLWAQVSDEGASFDASLHGLKHQRSAGGALGCSIRWPLSGLSASLTRVWFELRSNRRVSASRTVLELGTKPTQHKTRRKAKRAAGDAGCQLLGFDAGRAAKGTR